ncbi:hypothetical protein [Hydrocarboniphaga effusa]|uniref:hypothetical protein n=1 Tax=Hydrocarboniphaga effusa TaxID=243629 RepID=UPI00313791E6
MAPEDFIFLRPDAHRLASAPLSFEAFVDALHKHEAEMHWRQRSVYERREAALRRARAKDHYQKQKRRNAGDTAMHAAPIWIEGEEAKLRLEYRLPPRLTHDMGGKGNFARSEFLLAIRHLEHCLRHPVCSQHFAMTADEIDVALKQLAELEGLAFGSELRARVWTRVVTPFSPFPYAGIGDPEWTPHSAFGDFFGTRHPTGLLAGFESGMRKIRYEIERDPHWDAASIRAKDDAVRRFLEALYALPSLQAASEGQLSAAEHVRALHILIDGFPARFASLMTARRVLDFVNGVVPDETDHLESYFSDGEEPAG